jgi:hypothetical protein
LGDFITDSIYEGYHNFNLYFSQATTRLKLLNNTIYRPTYRYFPGYNMASPSLVKINATGHIDSVWDYAFSQPTRFTHYDYSPDNFIYAQAEIDDDTVSVAYESSGAILKLDTNGNELWRYTYNFSSQYADIPAGVQATEDSGCVFLCYSGAWPAYSQAKLVRLDKNGTVKWLRNVSIPIGIYFMKLVDYNTDENFVLTYFSDQHQDAQGRVIPSSLVKVDKANQIIWSIKNAEIDSFKTVINQFGDSGLVYVASVGTANYIKAHNGGWLGFGADGRDSLGRWIQGTDPKSGGYVRFINDSGRVVWEATYNGLYHGSKKVVGGYGFTGANLTSDGGYILTGSCFDSTGQQVGFLMKIDSMGCLSLDSCETRIVSSVRYNSNETPTISLYPNPAHNNVKLKLEQLNGLADVRISFYAVIGTKVFETRIEKPETEIATKDWERGIYFYRIEASGEVVKSGKLVVE